MPDLFSVVEYTSFFSVIHNPSGDEHHMGDGVDTLFNEDDVALSPGTSGFTREWENTLNEDEQSTLEAYFPQHIDQG